MIDNFWVRGIGLGTYSSRNDYEKFTLDDLWDMAKQVEYMEDSDRGGFFLPKFTIPYFSDGKFYCNLGDDDISHDTLCAVVGEERIRILVQPKDNFYGDSLVWCKENDVPLYCFVFGSFSSMASSQPMLKSSLDSKNGSPPVVVTTSDGQVVLSTGKAEIT
jgi:hypothetical protein